MNTDQTPSPSPNTDSRTAAIEAMLHDYCQTSLANAATVGEGYTRLWQEIDTYISGGGKRLRPRIFLMLYGFYGGKEDAALAAASAWELLHASLLIHDDIIDRDTIRHGKLNVAGQYQQTYGALTSTDAGHYALSAALLAGDLLISSAFDIVNQSNLAAAQKVLMQRYISKAIFAVGGGELIDTESALYPIESVDPYAIATYKTASYSFQLPMESGAALAGAHSDELHTIGEIGRHVGIAFQLKDDLLGIFGESAVTGKSNRSDLIEKKRTLIIQQALRKASPESKACLTELYAPGQALTDEEAEEVHALITATPVPGEIETLIEEHTSKALVLVGRLSISQDSQQELAALIASLVGRRA